MGVTVPLAAGEDEGFVGLPFPAAPLAEAVLVLGAGMRVSLDAVVEDGIVPSRGNNLWTEFRTRGSFTSSLGPILINTPQTRSSG